MNHLIRVSGAAINHRAIAVRLETIGRRTFGTPQRSQELAFIPRTQQDVITPFRVRVFDAVLLQLRPLLDGGGTRHVTEPAGVGAADGGIEGPIREAFVNEVVWRDERGGAPEINRRLTVWRGWRCDHVGQGTQVRLAVM